MILGVIPARGGSKAIPKKNLQNFAGKPLMAYTLEAALQSKKLDDLVVSTDDLEIANCARSYQIDVVDRPAELSGDAAPILEALRHALLTREKEKDVQFDWVVSMQANVPIRGEGVLDEALELMQNTNADSVVTVAKGKFPLEKMGKIESGRFVPYSGSWPQAYHRQQYRAYFAADGAVQVLRRKYVLNPWANQEEPHCYSYWGKVCVPLVQRLPEYSLEIDTWEEFYMAEILAEARQGKMKAS